MFAKSLCGYTNFFIQDIKKVYLWYTKQSFYILGSFNTHKLPLRFFKQIIVIVFEIIKNNLLY